MNNFKMKSLLYLLAFILSAVAYDQLIPETEQAQTENPAVLAEADTPDQEEKLL